MEYIISHERYEVWTIFDSLEQAQTAIRSLGEDFENVVLTEDFGGFILDDRNEKIGYKIESK